MFSSLYVINRTRNVLLQTYNNYSRSIKSVRKKRVADPGIRFRRNLIKNDKISEYEDVEEAESDFMKLGMAYDEHLKEIETTKENLKYHIVHQKYFKKNMPNFLTWNDKEQIRFLHRTEPEEWTIEKLSEAFPALPIVISKIVKGNWAKKSAQKIKKHDESVRQNWHKFENSELKELPDDLVVHLKKFTNRRLNLHLSDMPLKSEKQVYYKKKVHSEFSDIITSYENLINKEVANESELNPHKNIPLLEDGSSNWKQNKSRKQLTLSELKQKLASDENSNGLVTQKIENHEQVAELQNDDLALIRNKFANHSEAHSVATVPKKDYSFLMYPEKITIPKHLRRKGSIYKVNDCFYDHQGIFLYRVPGLVT